MKCRMRPSSCGNHLHSNNLLTISSVASGRGMAGYLDPPGDGHDGSWCRDYALEDVQEASKRQHAAPLACEALAGMEWLISTPPCATGRSRRRWRRSGIAETGCTRATTAIAIWPTPSTWPCSTEKRCHHGQQGCFGAAASSPPRAVAVSVECLDRVPIRWRSAPERREPLCWGGKDAQDQENVRRRLRRGPRPRRHRGGDRRHEGAGAGCGLGDGRPEWPGRRVRPGPG